MAASPIMTDTDTSGIYVCLATFASRTRRSDRRSTVSNVIGIVIAVTVSISITFDDELGEELNAAVAGSNRSDW